MFVSFFVFYIVGEGKNTYFITTILRWCNLKPTDKALRAFPCIKE